MLGRTEDLLLAHHFWFRPRVKMQRAYVPLRLVIIVFAVAAGMQLMMQALPASASSVVSAEVHPTVLARTGSAFLGVNIDAASLYQQTRLDFTDKAFRQLASTLANAGSGAGVAKMTLRIGGSAADDLGWDTSEHGSINLPATYWNEIVEFAEDMGFNLAWDLNMRIGRKAGARRDTAWDPQDFERQARHILDKGQTVWAFQLGNEPGHWQTRNGGFPTPESHGQDFLTLKSFMRTYFNASKSMPRIQGPDICFGNGTDTSPCATIAYLRTLLSVAAPALDDLTFHDYGFSGPNPRHPNRSQCGNISRFLDPDLWLGDVLPKIKSYNSVRQELAPKTKLVLSETATTADAGCPGKSNRFIAGFYFVDMLGALGEIGLHQVYRQDFVGFSGINGGSNYALAGQPGWFSREETGELRPHPDYFTALLWRSLVGNVRLELDVHSSRGSTAARFHAACATAGGVVVSFINPDSEYVPFALDTGHNISQENRSSFITGSEAMNAAASTARSLEVYILTAPSSNLTSDQILLNGQILTPSSELKPLLIAGSSPVHLPAYSYGFVVDSQALLSECPAPAKTF